MVRFEVVKGDTLKASLNAGEVVKAESDSVISRTSNVRIQGTLDGSVFGALKRRFLTGESVFLQELQAQEGPGEALLATQAPGEIIVGRLSETGPLNLMRGAYIASSSDAVVTSQMQSSLLRGFFSGAGLFIINVSGSGTVAFGSYGSLHRVELKANEVYAVDTQHIVAWSADMKYNVEFASGSVWSSVTSGEFLHCFFTGPGVVYVQSRSLSGLREWINSVQGGSNSSSRQTVACCSIGGLITIVFVILFFAAVVFAILNDQSMQYNSSGGGGSSFRNARMRQF